MWTNNEAETDYFLSFLKPEMRVLEFGSGSSTVELAGRVKEVVSIEHNKQWFDKVTELVPDNVKLIYCQQNKEPSPDYDDGTFEDFENYIKAPLSEGKFDLVFIDGRARVDCAKWSVDNYLKENGVIIIHDFGHPERKWRRHEYNSVLSFLRQIGKVFTMAAFKKI